MSNNKSPFVLEEIINTIPYHIFWKDADLNYLGANHLFATAAGFKSSEDIVGKNDFDGCWTKEESEFFRKMDREVMKGNKPILNIEEPQQQLDGSTVTLLTSKVPLHDSEGKVVGLLGVYTDITDRKNLELEKENALKELKVLQEAMIYQAKMTSLGEMAGGIAHEINNPLAIIGGQAHLIKKYLEKGADPKKITDACDSILTTVDRCTKIITNLMSFSRDSEDVDLSEVNLAGIVESVKSVSEQKIRSKSCNTTWEFKELWVKAKGISIEQGLLNLVSNALDAVDDVPESEVRIEVFSDQGTSGIRVSNTGEEIPKDIQSKIFQPFFTTKPIGKGTGLGLSTSKGLIEQSGGTITYHYSQGSNVFTLVFPSYVKKEVEIPSLQDSKPNILIVDDEPEIGQLLASHLELSFDCNLIVFTAAVEAYDYLEKNKNIDLVVSDIRMPEMDGVCFLEKIRDISPDLPLVVMISGFSEYTPEELANKGANLYLSKPINLSKLLEFIESQLMSKENIA